MRYFQAILAHLNTRVFFTHCGMHGVMEAIWHGVPVVGMPVFIDQGDVLVRMTERGITVASAWRRTLTPLSRSGTM